VLKNRGELGLCFKARIVDKLGDDQGVNARLFVATVAKSCASPHPHRHTGFRDTTPNAHVVGEKPPHASRILGQKTRMPGRSTYAPALPERHYAATNEGAAGRR
jgi:hypothetical protein